MRKTLLVLGGVLLVAIATLLILPSFWDWNRYRDDIAAQVRAATGREFAIEGDVRLTLLPAPSLSADGLRLANAPSFEAPDMATVDGLRVKLAFWPLLSGEVRAASIELIRPSLRLEQRPDGTANWSIASSPDVGGAEPDAPTGGDGTGLEVRLDSVRVRDGTVDLRLPGGRTLLTEINGDFSAESLSGPFRAEAALGVNGQPIAIDAHVGRFDTGAAEPIALAVDFGEANARLALLGTYEGATAGELRVAGDLHVDAGSTAALAGALAAALGQKRPDLPAGVAGAPATLEARLSLSPEGIALDALAASLGQTRAAGRIDVTLGTPVTIRADLTSPRIDADEWLAGASQQEQELTPATEQATQEEPAPAIPTVLNAAIELSADAVLLKGGVLRDARAHLTVTDGRLRVEAMSTKLPGAASASLSGAADLGAGGLRFDGPLEVRAGNLRGTLDWLGVELPSVPADRLRNFAATGRLSVEPEAITVSDLKLQVDATRLAGAVALARSGRLSFSASLEADRLNLDAYLPPTPDTGAASASETTPQNPAARPAPLSLASLAGFDANLDIRVEQLTYRRMPVQGVVLDALLFDGKLDVRQAGFDELAGMQARLTASLSGLGRGAAAGQVGVRAAVRDLPRSLRALDLQAPAAIEGIGTLTLDGTVAGDLKRAEIDATLGSGEARIRLAGTVEDIDGAFRYAAALTARDESSRRVLALLAPDLQLQQDPGPFSLSARFAGDRGGATLDGLEASVGAASLSGTGTARWDAAKPRIEASLAGGDLMLDPFLGAAPAPPRDESSRPTEAGRGGDRRWSSEPLDLAVLRSVDAAIAVSARSLTVGPYRLDEPSTMVTVEDGVLEIGGLRASLFGGGLDFAARLAAPADAPATANAKLTISNADVRQALFTTGGVDIVDGTLDCALEVATTGRTERELVGALAGQSSLQVRDGAVQGFDLKAVSDRLKGLEKVTDVIGLVSSAMSGGQTRFTSLDGTFRIDQGVAVSDDLHLVAEAGEGRGTARIDLPAWQLDLQSEFRLTDHPDAPPLGMQLVGLLDDPQRRFRTEALQAHLIERGVGGAIRGILKKDGLPRAEDLLPKLPPAPGGAAQPEAPAAPSAPDQKKITPEDAAKQLFRLFQR